MQIHQITTPHISGNLRRICFSLTAILGLLLRSLGCMVEVAHLEVSTGGH
jgi:hypothetical protein